MANKLGSWKIDGKEIPTPGKNSVTQSINKIWSSNTGRNATGSMQGTLVCVKNKVEITYPVLKPNDLKTISNIANSSKAWHNLTYYDMHTGTMKTITGYFGDGSGTLYGTNCNGEVLVTGYKIDFIEK